jgi:hypothetical protein
MSGIADNEMLKVADMPEPGNGLCSRYTHFPWAAWYATAMKNTFGANLATENVHVPVLRVSASRFSRMKGEE